MRDASRGRAPEFVRGASLARDTAGSADSPNTRPDAQRAAIETQEAR
jgi:hypothetical protein